MSQQVQAVYEGGVFRPLAPLTLPEHAQVTLDVLPAAAPAPVALSDEEFDRQLAELSTDGPTLPVDFSRADIYLDRD